MSIQQLIVSGISFFLGGLFPTLPNLPSPSPTPSTAEIQLKKIEVRGIEYAYDAIGPLKPSDVSLFSNLPKKQDSSELKQSHGCSALINGGFYTKENTHIGLFLVNNITYQEQSTNALFNGLIAATDQGIGVIGTILPDESLSFALQSGPLLLDDGSVLPLRIRNDENARRMAVGITNDNSLYFMALFFPNNYYGGPLLADVPEIISEINKQEGMNITTAINLDGGNHSAFLSKTSSLPELSPVGSFFCLKETD